MRDAATVTAVAQELRDRLMETVNRHARLARAVDEPPEQAVIRVKEATTEAIAIARSKTGTVDPLEAQALREQIVRWTIDADFGTIR